MRAPDDYGGVFTPEDLAEMQSELNEDAPPLETATERENRALGMFIMRQTRKLVRTPE